MSQRQTRKKQEKERSRQDIKITFLSELEMNEPSTLTLDEYVVAAYEHQNEQEDVEQYRSPLWEFVRLLKAHPSLTNLSAELALTKVETIMDQWHQTEEDLWNPWFGNAGSSEDARIEFLTIWDSIRYLPGRTPLDNAIERAKRTSFVPELCPTDGYRRFITLAGCLQEVMGDRNIYLPCHKLTDYLGCKAMTISRYRQMAVHAGIIKIISPHKFSLTGMREATEFRFNFSMVSRKEKT